MEYTHIRVDKETKERLEKLAGGTPLSAYLREFSNGKHDTGELSLKDLANQIGEFRSIVLRALGDMKKLT